MRLRLVLAVLALASLPAAPAVASTVRLAGPDAVYEGAPNETNQVYAYLNGPNVALQETGTKTMDVQAPCTFYDTVYFGYSGNCPAGSVTTIAAILGDGPDRLLVAGFLPVVADLGSGPDTATTAGGNDDVTGGEGQDVIDTGAGSDVVDAHDGGFDTVRCGDGPDTVYADCETVVRGARPDAPALPAPTYTYDGELPPPSGAKPATPETPATTPATTPAEKPAAPAAPLVVSVDPPRLGTLLSRGLRVRARCGQGCRPQVRILAGGARRLHLTSAVLAQGTTAADGTVRLRPGAAARKALRRTLRLPLTVEITGAGQTQVLHLVLRR